MPTHLHIKSGPCAHATRRSIRRSRQRQLTILQIAAHRWPPHSSVTPTATRTRAATRSSRGRPRPRQCRTSETQQRGVICVPIWLACVVISYGLNIRIRIYMVHFVLIKTISIHHQLEEHTFECAFM